MRKVFNVVYEIYLFTDFDFRSMPTKETIGITEDEQKAREYCAKWNKDNEHTRPFTTCRYRERMEEILEI